MVLRALGPELWVCERTFRHAGLPMRSRMTVVRLDDGRLWLHSPVAPTHDVVRAVERLGPVCDLVIPNRFHHLWADAWRAEMPEARLFAPECLKNKRPRLNPDEILGTDAPRRWHGCFGMARVGGAPLLGEMVFLHHPSRTLIVTDLLSNVQADDPWGLRAWAWLNGAYGRPATSLMVRFLVTRRAVARESIARILEWDFVRVVVGHGAIIEIEPRAALRRALAWLRPDPPA